MNLFAYTELYDAGYPAYISLNRNNYDQPVFSVRSRNAQNASYISMSVAELTKLRDTLNLHLEKVAQE